MSHRVSSNPEFADMGRTCRAFEALGWKVDANATEGSAYYGGKKFPFVARNPDKQYKGWDIGLEIDPKTKKVKMSHESMLPLDQFFGPNLSKLKQEYTKLALFDETEKHMGICNFETLADGSVGVEIEVELTV